MRAVANKIREHVLMSGYDKLLAAVERELDRRATRAPVANQAGMRRQLAGIEQKIENATDRLVSVAKSLVPAVEAKLVDLQRQRDELAERLHRSPNSPSSVTPRRLQTSCGGWTRYSPRAVRRPCATP